MNKMIYLDYNATTPVDAEARQAMQPFLDHIFGNPSSTHGYGVEARKAVEEARNNVAKLINAAPHEIIFTSGGTEASNFAIKGVAYQNRYKGNHIITTQIEHPATSEVCLFLESEGFRVSYIEVDKKGIVNLDELRAAITPSTILISVMHANNETGVIQPIEEIGKLARQHNILFHCDAAQSAGKIPVDVTAMQVDLLSLAGHKFYAPKGIGALYLKSGIKLQKLIHGASHEQNLRAGTENILEIAGLGAAAKVALRDMKDNARQMKLTRDLLHDLLKKEIPTIHLNGAPDHLLPNTLNISFPAVEANLLLDELTAIAASAGAACHSDSIDISPVLRAMKIPPDIAKGTIRFSTGKHTTEEEIREAARQIIAAVKRLQPEENVSPEPFALETGPVKLTRYTQGLGCACKIRPQYLERVLQNMPAITDPNVLVEASACDDAAV
ncbi:MAG: IscS subfamily cysteine desulfurase, partial [Bacteroidota bacterium]